MALNLSPANMLSEMIAFAAQKHKGQTDKGGNPYILHPLAVMGMLGPDSDLELKCIAVGHDLVEDCKVTYQDLRDLGMSDRVIDGIRCLTKVPGETYQEYKSRVLSNEDAMQVKQRDLQHNSDIRRLKGVGTPQDDERLRKYAIFHKEIQGKLSMSLGG